MDALSHYHLSQEYAAIAGQNLERYRDDDASAFALVLARTFSEVAQAHATLALTGVTALRGTHHEGELPLADANAWFGVVSYTAPIPAETDPQDGPHPEDVWPAAPACVGSISPDDPELLGRWLRELPLRTILRDRDFNPCQREIGEEHIHGAPAPRWFPALFVFGDTFEISEGHEQIASLAKHNASFTVLALGDGTQDGGSDG